MWLWPTPKLARIFARGARGVLLGANGYVTKPYSAGTLLSAIKKALDLV